MITISLFELHEFNCSATPSVFAEIFGEHLADHHWKAFVSNKYQLPLHKLSGVGMEKISEFIAAKRPTIKERAYVADITELND